MPTIRDVAQAADLPAATVSHLLNDTCFVSEAPRQRVFTAIDRLGPQPNALAISLRHNRVHARGMILPDSANPFTAEIARRIGRASIAHSYSMILCNMDHAALFNLDRGGNIGTKPSQTDHGPSQSFVNSGFHPKEDLRCPQSAIP